MARTPAKDKDVTPDGPAPRRGRAAPVSGDAGTAAMTAFGRAGFSDPSLVLHWERIAGPQVARMCQPVKLVGEILTVKALPGAALFLAHEKRELMGRINAYLGRAAVSQIKFLQGGFAVRPASPPPGPKPGALPPADPARRFAGPEKLAEALEKLGRRRAQD